MRKIVWTNEAKEDLEAIYESYASKNLIAVAVAIYNEILEEADILMSFPEIASIELLLDDMEFTFRSLVIRSGIYKIIYFTDKNNVVITHVWDCRRNPSSLPKRNNT